MEQGRLEAALPFLEQALETAEQIRSRLSDPDFRSCYFSSFKNYFDAYIDLLLKLHARHPGGGYLARAFEATERSRARGLLDALGGLPVRGRRRAIPPGSTSSAGCGRR